MKIQTCFSDHYDRSSGAEELDIFKQLYDSVVSFQPKLSVMAAESIESNDDSISDILQVSVFM